MKQSLQLRLGQQLTMTPQLQQAIRLLQLPTLELRAEIQQALESNLMLEAAEDGEEAATEEALHDPYGERDDSEGDNEAQAAEPNEAGQTRADDEPDARSLGEDLPVDSAWDDIYDGATVWSRGDPEQDEREAAGPAPGTESLRDHLLWQARMSDLPPRELAIAEAIIDAIREDGYLAADPAELVTALPADWQVTSGEIEAVLLLVQRFDPAGVAARDPAECLLLQLEQMPAETPWRDEAMAVVGEHLELLASRQTARLKRRTGLGDEALAAVLGLIQGLDPHPGLRYGSQQVDYVIPDVFVRAEDGRWQVEINPDALPRVRINAEYASLVRRADRSPDNRLMREHLQEARWLVKSLRSRNDTLVRVARFIVDHQHDFLEHGEEHMQPLVLREVAEAVEMHESTISRITNQKYMHTPRGTFEFKYFFSSHVQTNDGGECSATAIRARIRRLIAGEDARRPLSDSRIASILQDEGINVARRTVAKYREAMSIASSTERKRLA
ncbi:RNA polymerase factor sigma-54 [Arhodomonas sp. SL1]|uniref:RNA polymerase factor sigma-54 n=1 Tax=Arhodomonas sp. SL1 TaxID=3425691 RepID=UPI003F880FB1